MAKPSRKLIPLLLVLHLTLLVIPGCARPVSDGTQPAPGFDLSDYEVRELPIAGGTPLGKLPDGSLVIAVQQRRNIDYPIGIYLTDPATGLPTALFHIDQPRIMFGAVLTGETVVWVETGEDMIMADWRMFIRNLLTGNQRELDHGQLQPENTPVRVPTLFAPVISVSGNLLVWTTFEPGGPAGARAVLRLYDLTAGKSEILDEVDDISWDELGLATISGDRVAYNPGHIDPERQARYGTVVLLDLKTRERRVLAEGYNVASPSICGRYVVWASGRYSIKLYDLETRAERTVVTGGASERWDPGVNDQIVVWMHTLDEVVVAPVSEGGVPVTIGPGVSGGSLSGPFLYWHARVDQGGIVTRYIDFSEGR